MNKLYFASSNENKFHEINKICRMEEDVELIFSKIAIIEIQSDSLIEVAQDKVKKAFETIRKPLIVEDDGLFIKELNNFPGIYSSFVFKTIGNKGILKLLENHTNREAIFVSAYSFFDGKNIKTFIGQTKGLITNEIIGKGWGYDPIFKPDSENNTYGQLSHKRKNEISHRSKAFKIFIKWYKENCKI